jgi:hypothetical protein
MSECCEVCGVRLVEQRMPMRMRYGGKPGLWIPEDEQTFLVHPWGSKCAAGNGEQT